MSFSLPFDSLVQLNTYCGIAERHSIFGEIDGPIVFDLAVGQSYSLRLICVNIRKPGTGRVNGYGTEYRLPTESNAKPTVSCRPLSPEVNVIDMNIVGSPGKCLQELRLDGYSVDGCHELVVVGFEQRPN